jgi:hypothetical protein
MGLRKGVYVGYWCPPEVKKALQEIAASEHRTLSQELNRLSEWYAKVRRLPSAEERKEEVRS